MILLVLLHKGRGGGLSDMFGGGVSSSLGGSSVAERNLDRLTVGIGVIWFACVIALGLLLAYVESEQEGHRRGWWRKRDPGEPGRRRPDGRGRARRGRAPAGGHLLLLARAPVGGDVRGRGAGPGVVGLPQVRAAGQPGLGQPAAGAEDRALQDAPRLREGAPLRRGGRRHPRRGASSCCAPAASPATSSSEPRSADAGQSREAGGGCSVEEPRHGRRCRRGQRPTTPAAGDVVRRRRRARARATASAFSSPLTRNHTARARLSAREGQGDPLRRRLGRVGAPPTAIGRRRRARLAREQRGDVAVGPDAEHHAPRTRRLPCSRSSSAYAAAASVDASRRRRWTASRARGRVDADARRGSRPRLAGVAVGASRARRTARRPTRPRPATSRPRDSGGEPARSRGGAASAIVPPVSTIVRLLRRPAWAVAEPATAARRPRRSARASASSWTSTRRRGHRSPRHLEQPAAVAA